MTRATMPASTVFYVVSNRKRVKIGITSDHVSRIKQHFADDEYKTIHRLWAGLPIGTAAGLESLILDKLRELGIAPVKGREYFNAIHRNDILRIADDSLGFDFLTRPKRDTRTRYRTIDEIMNAEPLPIKQRVIPRNKPKPKPKIKTSPNKGITGFKQDHVRALARAKAKYGT